MWKPLVIRNIELKTPLFQGGMGIGVSLEGMARAVAREGGLGIISSAALDLLLNLRLGRKVTVREAAMIETQLAKVDGGFVGMNVMVALTSTYEESVLGAMDGGIDAVVSGAGMPWSLPGIAKKHFRYECVSLIPIISSPRALRLICERWRKNHDRLPDAAVFEGPLAGGHLGSKKYWDPSEQIESMIAEILSVARHYGGFPIIVAGGVFYHEDVRHYISDLGAQGVQIGQRFAVTFESKASREYKDAVLGLKYGKGNIIVSDGSPCNFPFRIIDTSPMLSEMLAKTRPPHCSKGYLLFDGKCLAITCPEAKFCICNGLSATADAEPNEKQLFTVSARAAEIKREMSVEELMHELTTGIRFER